MKYRNVITQEGVRVDLDHTARVLAAKRAQQDADAARDAEAAVVSVVPAALQPHVDCAHCQREEDESPF